MFLLLSGSSEESNVGPNTLAPILFVTPGNADRMDSEAIDFGGGVCVADPAPFPDAGTLFSSTVGAYVGGDVLVCEEQCFTYDTLAGAWNPAAPLMERRNYPRSDCWGEKTYKKFPLLHT